MSFLCFRFPLPSSLSTDTRLLPFAFCLLPLHRYRGPNSRVSSAVGVLPCWATTVSCQGRLPCFSSIASSTFISFVSLFTLHLHDSFIRLFPLIFFPSLASIASSHLRSNSSLQSFDFTANRLHSITLSKWFSARRL